MNENEVRTEADARVRYDGSGDMMARRGRGNRENEGGTDAGSKDIPVSRYDDELLSANWNPVIDLLAGSRTSNEANEANKGARSAARALREEDVDAFLGRIYALGG